MDSLQVELNSRYKKKIDGIDGIERNFERYQSREAGYDKLIFYNHFLIATCGIKARHGTIGADVNHYARWSEAFPLTKQDIEKMCNGKSREQEVLIAGMLSKSHLLDLLKNYVIYELLTTSR
jgi:type I restriction enzyme, R subunit